MMKHRVLLSAFAVLALATSQQAHKPDFSGTWVLNVAQSKLQVPPPKSGTLVIRHKEPAFSFKRTFESQEGEDTWTADLTTDGKEVIKNENDRVSCIRLYWEGNDLVYSSIITLGNREGNDKSRYHLSDDRKSLTATESFKAPAYSYDNLWIFEKK